MIKANGSGLSQKAMRALEIMKERRLREVALADKFLEVIKGRTPVGKSTWGERVEPTGLTRKSWTIHILQNDVNGVRWTINADGREDIVMFLEYGTADRFEPIVPKTPGGVLAFEWGQKGIVFLKHVHHKGIKPLGIVRITQDELNADANRLTEEMHVKLRSVGSSRG